MEELNPVGAGPRACPGPPREAAPTPMMLGSRVGWFCVAAAGLMLAAETAVASAAGAYNVRDYGATGDGRTLDTPAINKAIEACAEVGGGQVRFPPGRY